MLRSIFFKYHWGIEMKPGTIIKLPDGKIGTIVYHSLDGYGIQWGRVRIERDEILKANPLFGHPPLLYKWYPEAMLRDDYPGASIECVGNDYEILDD